MNGIDDRITKRVLIALLVVIAMGAVAQVVFINVFNQTAHTVSGADDTQQTYLRIHDRDDSTSSWVKRNYNLRGNTVDLLAQTVDGTLYNETSDTVSTWQLRIDIEDECFINNAWCGTVEIHQYAGTEREAVQTLDLRSYDIKAVKLDYLYDGDLLIPLQKGDYLIYYPSEKDDELRIAPHSELTMGMIFYYRNDLDLSNYVIDYQYHRDYTYGWGFAALVALAVAWILLFAGRIIAAASYKRALNMMELRASGLASMSSLYSIIYLIDLEADELVPISGNENSKAKMPRGSDARSRTLEIFSQDTADSHREEVLEFVDLSTLPKRLGQNSIACEYVSKQYGWSEARFFPVDREEGQPLQRVLLTIEDINDEKRRIDKFEERVAEEKRESKMRSAYIAGVANGMRRPIDEILELDERILSESGEEAIKAYAHEIRIQGRTLSYMIDTTLDSAMISAGTMEVASEEYSLGSLVDDICETAQTIADVRGHAFSTDISAPTSGRFLGDAPRIERAAVGLLARVSSRLNGGEMKLSVFGKAIGNAGHLLFSVHANGFRLSDEEMRRITGFVSRIKSGEGAIAEDGVQELEAIAALLGYLDSELHVVNGPGDECEFYFELDQEARQ